MQEIKGVDSKFRKVILIASRAKQLIRGSKKRVELKNDNPLAVAFEEFEQGKITYDLLREEENRQLEAEAAALLAVDPSAKESEEMLATLHSIQDTTETEPDEEEKQPVVEEAEEPV